VYDGPVGGRTGVGVRAARAGEFMPVRVPGSE